MTQGQQLKQFIDNQPKSKISIAKDLGMSKQNLFAIFNSKELSEENKKKFEGYFGKTIFTQSMLTNDESQPVKEGHTKYKEPLETAIENLSISKVIDSRNMERLILLLQAKLGGLPDMTGFTQPGTKGSETGTRKANSGAK